MSNKRSGNEISYREQLANAGGGKRCKQQASSLLADVRKVGKRKFGREKGGGSFALLARLKSPFPQFQTPRTRSWGWRDELKQRLRGRLLVTQARPPWAVPKISDQPRHCPKFRKIAPVFEKVDINAIPGINLYPVDSTISFRCTYLPDRDLWSFIRWIVACVAGGIGGECCCFLAAELRTPARSWGRRKKMRAEKKHLIFFSLSSFASHSTIRTPGTGYNNPASYAR